ncbi:MAG: lamin tail domain-containing protein [Bacteroidota bacterium]
MIRSLCLIIAVLSWFSAFAQLQDDFSDGDLSINPTWQGDVDSFIVNDNFEVQLQANTSGRSTLYVPVDLPDSVLWTFYFRLEFAPSSSNQLRIYLQADQADLESANGYFLQVGESGNGDAIRLFRQDGGTSTELASGAMGALGSADATARVQISRSSLGSWALLTDYTGGSNFQTEVNFEDDSYGGGMVFFGWQCQYSESRRDKFFFDDISIAALMPDLEAPQLVEAKPLSANQIDLQFNERLDPSSVANIGLYSIDGGIGQPTSAELDADEPTLVHLNLGTDLVSQQVYTIVVEGIEDLAGNASSAQSALFTYFFVEEAAPFDLLINEIMADPNPPIGLPEAEYVELYNRSDKIIDLASLAFFEEGNTASPLPSFFLLPKAYVLLCNPALIDSLSGFGDVVSPSNFSVLTNSGERLVLARQDMSIIHQVNYTDEWYGDPERDGGGWSLEMINPELYCQEQANWQASNATAGGTPGQQNANFSDLPDEIPPQILSAQPVGDELIRLFFDEILNPDIAVPGLYTLSPDAGAVLGVIIEEPAKTSVLLQLEGPILEDGTTYTVSLDESISDCSGNPIGPGQSVRFDYFEERIANRYDIVINEIMADPTQDGGLTLGLPAKEYLELYNRSDKVFNLENFVLLDIEKEVRLPYHLLFPGDYLTIYERGGAGFGEFGDTLVVDDFLSLGNDVDGLVLLNSDLEILHSVIYTSSWYQDNSKRSGSWSLEMINPDRPCETSSNWRASINGNGGTPGQENSIFDPTPDTQRPDLLRAFPLSDTEVQLFFSEAISDSVALLPETYEIEDLEVINVRIDIPLFQSLILEFDRPMEAGVIYEVNITSDFSDCVGNGIGMMNSTRFGLPQQIEPNAIVINEVLFNPSTGGVRFVELYNRSDRVLNVGELVLAGRNEEDLISPAFPVISDYLLFPSEYVVITPSPMDILSRYTVNQPSALLTSPVPSYDDQEDAVLIYLPGQPEALIIDEFQYTADLHQELLDDQNGVSLERISPEEPTQLAANWHSAAQSAGFATPTSLNSQFYLNPGSGAEIIELPRNRFSPDEDGFEDFLLIDYNTEQAGYTANIRIYDARGRLIKDLISNELLAPAGSFKWDGSNEEGTKARIGIYVVWVELFTPAGEVQQIKKTCVLAGQL